MQIQERVHHILDMYNTNSVIERIPLVSNEQHSQDIVLSHENETVFYSNNGMKILLVLDSSQFC